MLPCQLQNCLKVSLAQKNLGVAVGNILLTNADVLLLPGLFRLRHNTFRTAHIATSQFEPGQVQISQKQP